jgi:hypothetical protein
LRLCVEYIDLGSVQPSLGIGNPSVGIIWTSDRFGDGSHGGEGVHGTDGAGVGVVWEWIVESTGYIWRRRSETRNRRLDRGGVLGSATWLLVILAGFMHRLVVVLRDSRIS